MALNLPPNLARSLQGMWLFDNTLYDQSPNLYHLTNNGSSFGVGPYKGAIVLNGSSQYANIANALCPNLETTGDQSIVLWVKPTSVSVQQTPWGKVNASANTGRRIGISNTGTVQFSSFKTGDDQSVITTATLTAGIWNFIGVSYTNSGQSVIINTNGTDKTGSFTRAIIADTSSFTVGRLGDLNGEYFGGSVGPLMFFNRPLTSAEMNDLRNNFTNYYAYAKGAMTKSV